MAAAQVTASGGAPAGREQHPHWRRLLERCWTLLQCNLWPLLIAHAATDALVFLLHRLSHRATNEGECKGQQFGTELHAEGCVLL